MASLLHYLRESLEFGPDDWQWIKVGGGYLSHKVNVPPMGKYNPGQKLYYLAILIAGIAIAASGFAIWLLPDDRGIRIASHLVHNLAFSLFIVAVPVHVYLGTLANPGTFRIMVYGTVPVEFARKRYPKWMKEIGKQ
jgi:formate dehydrogenase subunit gamma